MKYSTIITSIMSALLITSTYASDVELVCSQTKMKEDGSSVTYTLLQDINTRYYSLLEEGSGFNAATGKSTRNINFLQNQMECSIQSDHSFQCEQIRITNSDPHDTFNKFTLTKSPGINSYSLDHYSTYQEYRTGRWVESNEKLSGDLFCK